MGRVRVPLTGSADMRDITDRPTNHCMLNQTLAEWEEELVWDHLDLAEGYDLAWLAETFRNRKALFICNGSYQPDLCRQLGSLAWIIEFTNTGRRVIGILRSTTKEANA